MKNSKKFFWIVFGVLIAIPIICLISFRAVIGKNSSLDYKQNPMAIESGKIIEKNYELKDFDSITIAGAWEVNTIQGNEYSVYTKCDTGFSKNVLVEKRGKTLYVGKINNKKHFTPYKGIATITIVTPKLKNVSVEGGTDLEIKDFNANDINFNIEGAANVVAKNCTYNNLTLDAQGAANCDFNESKITNAKINIDGAANIEIKMAGGELTGKLSGIGNIAYSGEVKLVDIKKDGIGVVERKD